MHIIPAIYLSDGNAVSHYKGKAEQTTILSRDPLASAQRFQKQGAKVIHLVDSDTEDGVESADSGAKNREIAKSIAVKTGLFVQYADGIRSLNDIADLLEAGVDFVGLDQFSEHLLEDAGLRFGKEKLFFTIRAEGRTVEGRKGVEVVDYGKDLAGKGITHIVFRDIKAEGTFHPNYDEVERLVMYTPAKIFAFGGIGSMKNLRLLEGAGATGAIISRAFFEKKLSLKECIETLR